MTKSKNNKEKKDKVKSAQPHLNDNGSDTGIKEKQCTSCFQTICASAKICQHCGQRQNFWSRFFMNIVLTLPIFMLIIAAFQLTLAFKEREDASSTLETAKTAAKDANEALSQVLSDANEINILKHVVKNQGATIEFSIKEVFKTKNLLEKLSKQFQLINNFMMTVINAQNYDRKAFDQLEIWSKDKTFLLSPQAFKAWVNILDQHNQSLFKEPGSFPWEEGTDPSKLNLSDLKRKYETTNWYIKPSLIKYIWERKDFSKYERMEFLAYVLKNDQSLRAVEYAGRYFRKEAGLKKKTLAVSEFLDWWEKNKEYLKE